VTKIDLQDRGKLIGELVMRRGVLWNKCEIRAVWVTSEYHYFATVIQKSRRSVVRLSEFVKVQTPSEIKLYSYVLSIFPKTNQPISIIMDNVRQNMLYFIPQAYFPPNPFTPLLAKTSIIPKQP